MRVELARAGGGEGHGDRKDLGHVVGHVAGRGVGHFVGHFVDHVVDHVVGRVVGRVAGRVAGRAAIGAPDAGDAGDTSGYPDGCNCTASSSSLGCCGPSATGGGGIGRDTRETARNIGAIGPGTWGPVVDAAGTGANARGSGGIGIRSVSGEIGVADTVPDAEEAVQDTVRAEGSLDGRREKADSGHV